MLPLYCFHRVRHRWCWPLSHHDILPTNTLYFPGRQNAPAPTETQRMCHARALVACSWGGLINWKRSSNGVWSFPCYLPSRPGCAGPGGGRDRKTAPAGPHPSTAAGTGKWDGDQGIFLPLCPSSVSLSSSLLTPLTTNPLFIAGDVGKSAQAWPHEF